MDLAAWLQQQLQQTISVWFSSPTYEVAGAPKTAGQVLTGVLTDVGADFVVIQRLDTNSAMAEFVMPLSRIVQASLA